MATLDEVGQALDALESAGLARSNVTVLQCTTNYPAPPDETNLRAMVAMHEQFSVDVGFSDHTRGIEASLAAVALGATVIEKHLTLDKDLPGPDHFASADPQEFRSMVEGIRKVERMLGSSSKAPTASELDNRGIVRKSIVATAKIQAGEVFSTQNVGVKRPADGFSPMKWHDVIGAKARRNFEPNDRIELE
jgi:N,N'-diacetyllegionaminate synthase